MASLGTINKFSSTALPQFVSLHLEISTLVTNEEIDNGVLGAHAGVQIQNRIEHAIDVGDVSDWTLASANTFWVSHEA
jgi:hypothetical protein